MNGISRKEFLAIRYFYRSQQPLFKSAMVKVKKGDELFNLEAKGLMERTPEGFILTQKGKSIFLKEERTRQ